jgi:hypothetical protein
MPISSRQFAREPGKLAFPERVRPDFGCSLPFGRVTVIRAADQLEVLAVNDLGEAITATPAVLQGRLYVRTAGDLYAFGE